MSRIAITGIICSALLSCSGQGAQVAAVVATGAALKTAQMIQEKRREERGETYECTNPCTYNQVPCGDECLPQGAACYKAPRRACYGGDPNAPEERLPMQEPHPGAQQDVLIFAPVDG